MSEQHNLCRYKEGEMGPSCGGATETPVNEADQTLITNLHNAIRSTVAQGKANNQPNAANMREMVSLHIIVLLNCMSLPSII